MATRKEQTNANAKANDNAAMQVLTEPTSMRGFSYKQELVLTTIQSVGVLGAGVLGLVAACIGAKTAASTAAANMATMQMYTQTNNKGGKN